MKDLKKRIKSFIKTKELDKLDEMEKFVDTMDILELESVNQEMTVLNSTGKEHAISMLSRIEGNISLETRYYILLSS